jgi:hypothetical protein
MRPLPLGVSNLAACVPETTESYAALRVVQSCITRSKSLRGTTPLPVVLPAVKDPLLGWPPASPRATDSATDGRGGSEGRDLPELALPDSHHSGRPMALARLGVATCGYPMPLLPLIMLPSFIAGVSRPFKTSPQLLGAAMLYAS